MINNTSLFNGFKINNSYTHDKRQLRRLIGLLKSSQENMRRPHAFLIVCNYTDGLNRDLVNALRKYPDTKYFWTRENSEAKGHHLQIVFVFDGHHHSVIGFPYQIQRLLSSLDTFSSVQLCKRKRSLTEDGEQLLTHDLRTEFNDAVFRYGYNCKLEQKEGVHGRTFGSSAVDKRYLNIKNDNPVDTKVTYDTNVMFRPRLTFDFLTSDNSY